jgi:hypothetical protein
MICRFKAGDLLRKPLTPRSCPQKLPTVSGCLEEDESIGSPRVWSKCGDNSWSARTVIARQATISLFLFPQDVAACARRVLSGCSSSRCAPRVGPVRCLHLCSGAPRDCGGAARSIAHCSSQYRSCLRLLQSPLTLSSRGAQRRNDLPLCYVEIVSPPSAVRNDRPDADFATALTNRDTILTNRPRSLMM